MSDLRDDDLDTILDAAWQRLRRAAADGRSAFATMQLASLAPDGRPRARSVVLRAVDPSARRLDCHTDRRSGKAAEIAADDRVALHFWDPRAKLQLRIEGRASLSADSPESEAAWSRLTPAQRAIYAAPVAPGTHLAAPAEADDPRDPVTLGPQEGRDSFLLVQTVAERIEWLHLRRGGHRRARFDWQDRWSGRWIAP